MVLRGPSRGTVVDAGGRNRASPNRSARPGRAHHRLCGVGGNRDGWLRTEPRPRPDHRLVWLYASVLEYLQNFSPGRNPAVVDFAASAFGALCGGGAVLLLWRWRLASLGS